MCLPVEQTFAPRIGAWFEADQDVVFTVWAPCQKKMLLAIRVGSDIQRIPMDCDEQGYWHGRASGLIAGTRYCYILDDGQERPDPASFWQPDGVHAWSALVDHRVFAWGADRDFKGPPPRQWVIYELHVGTFTAEGTFAAILPRLPELVDLGITAIEIMPVAQFPGTRNWGYDGVYPFAVQHSYGGVEAFKELVNACHARQLSVILDVVYNHLGPEGNYLNCYGPYVTDRYRTPWGSAINFDGADSDAVRAYFLQNARYWFEQVHIDGLRLDAVHGIVDTGARHILEELARQTAEFSRTRKKPYYLIAESDLNDARLVRWPIQGGYGIDAQWSDDFHHSLHAVLTGERDGYYADFGGVEHLAKAMADGLVYDGRYSAFRRRRHGNAHADIAPEQLVVCSQNHDQIGNRRRGERLAALVDGPRRRFAAAAVLLSAYVPLLFMGEEYGETQPFLYVISHGDEQLVAAVRRGRAEEFRAFGWQEAPPDPQDEETFRQSQLRWERRQEPAGKALRDFYRYLLRLRREQPVLAQPERQRMESGLLAPTIIWWRRWQERSELMCFFNAGAVEQTVQPAMSAGSWRVLVDSGAASWGGGDASVPAQLQPRQLLRLAAWQVALYEKEVLR